MGNTQFLIRIKTIYSISLKRWIRLPPLCKNDPSFIIYHTDSSRLFAGAHRFSQITRCFPRVKGSNAH